MGFRPIAIGFGRETCNLKADQRMMACQRFCSDQGFSLRSFFNTQCKLQATPSWRQSERPDQAQGRIHRVFAVRHRLLDFFVQTGIDVLTALAKCNDSARNTKSIFQ